MSAAVQIPSSRSPVQVCRLQSNPGAPVLSARTSASMDPSHASRQSSCQTPSTKVRDMVSTSSRWPKAHVLLVSRPDDDSHLRIPGTAGHPDTIDTFREAGHRVHFFRASCRCQGDRLAKEGQVAELFGQTTRIVRNAAFMPLAECSSPSSSSSSSSSSSAPGDSRFVPTLPPQKSVLPKLAAAPATGVVPGAQRQVVSIAPLELARALTMMRCWEKAARLARPGSQRLPDRVTPIFPGDRLAPVLILEAGCRAPSKALWEAVLKAADELAGGVEDLVEFGPAGSYCGAYALAPQVSGRLSTYWEKIVAGGVGTPQDVWRWFQECLGLKSKSTPLLTPPVQGLTPTIKCPIKLPKPPPLTPAPLRKGDVKIYLITLPHRSDRRKMPLVGSDAALTAMTAAGFDVEILRASCYCERDAFEARGELGVPLQEMATPNRPLHWVSMRRYKGADVKVGKEEAAKLRAVIDEHYQEGGGAERLVDSMGGTDGVEGYIVDSNWPGATGCAISHVRALMTAALEGYSFTLVFEDDAVIPLEVSWRRGWCTGACTGEICWCPSAWAACVEDAVDLARRAVHESEASKGKHPGLDVLYLGTGEMFEPPGPAEGLLAGEGGMLGSLRRWFARKTTHLQCAMPGWVPRRMELGGLTELGYTWQAQAMLYTRRALDDVLKFPLSDLIWAHDETIPHLYGRMPWNHRYLDALREVGWTRKWVAAAPSDADSMGWVYQLETLTSEAEHDLGLGSAWQSSNAEEF